jgi:hypothetical protein
VLRPEFSITKLISDDVKLICTQAQTLFVCLFLQVGLVGCLFVRVFDDDHENVEYHDDDEDKLTEHE